MILTEGQESALQAVRKLNKDFPEGGGIGIIAGYAGTGKSTLIKVLAEEYDNILVITPTGKAAVRVREIADCEACTIHSWLYEVSEDEDTGELKFQRKQASTIDLPSSGFVIIDEASMVTVGVFVDILWATKKLGLNLILIGDEFQLPPVEHNLARKDFSVFAADFPADFKVKLTEIHRQALDSPIIRASMEVRTGRWANEAMAQLPVVTESKLLERAAHFFNEEGATIVHRNATRMFVNTGIRTHLGLPPSQIVVNEPLLVIQNTHSIETYNGEIVTVLSQPSPANVVPIAVVDKTNDKAKHMNFLEMEVMTPVKGAQSVMVADAEVFGDTGGVGGYAIKRAARILKSKKYGELDGVPQGPAFLPANFGYALTCHKAQGSEFPAGIVVIEDSLRLNTTEGKRWAYTALTRFKKHLEICWRV